MVVNTTDSPRGFRVNANRLVALAVVLIIAIGGYAAFRARASGFFAATEADGGTLTGNAATVSDSAASGGKALVFNAPAGGGTGSSCTQTANTAGGTDPWGGCWPGANNTGIPAGTSLTAYTGSCTITAANTVIDSKTVNCDLDVQAAGLIIKNSKVNGQVTLRSDLSGATGWSITIQDSEVDGGTPQEPTVSGINLTVLRSNIHGGSASVHCDELSSSTCDIENSWLHGQYMPTGANWHLSAFSLKGGYNVTLKHNVLACDITNWNNDGGCTADVDLIPNFAPVSHVLVDHNLLVASMSNSYCAYGGEGANLPYPHADHTVFQYNVFQRGTNSKCGAYGPVTDFNVSGTGNAWTNNTWTDGSTVPPAM